MAWYPGKRLVEAAKKVRKKSRAKSAKKILKKDLNLNISKKQAEKYGKVRKGVANVKLTDGGAYPSYKKKSKAAGSFRSAFKKNCAGKGAGDTFTWDGRKYSCARAEGNKKKKYTVGAKTFSKKADAEAAALAKLENTIMKLKKKEIGYGKKGGMIGPAKKPKAS